LRTARRPTQSTQLLQGPHLRTLRKANVTARVPGITAPLRDANEKASQTRVRKINPDKNIASAIERGVREERDGKFFLTPGGREIAEHMQLTIPFFVGTLFSAKVVSIVTIAVHILLSVLKLTFGFISGSAGLIADGIDNTVDTVSSVLVWLGIKYNRERLVSLWHPPKFCFTKLLYLWFWAQYA